MVTGCLMIRTVAVYLVVLLFTLNIYFLAGSNVMKNNNRQGKTPNLLSGFISVSSFEEILYQIDEVDKFG